MVIDKGIFKGFSRFYSQKKEDLHEGIFQLQTSHS